MAYANDGGFDIASELDILHSFAAGLESIASSFVKKYEEHEKKTDSALGAAMKAQCSLIADRLTFIRDEFADLSFDSRQEVDRLLAEAKKASFEDLKVVRFRSDSRGPGVEPASF